MHTIRDAHAEIFLIRMAYSFNRAMSVPLACGAADDGLLQAKTLGNASGGRSWPDFGELADQPMGRKTQRRMVTGQDRLSDPV